MDLLRKALDAAVKILKDKATHKLLPEDKALIEREVDGPGKHIHDEANSLGIHRHLVGDPIDGGHTHTPENPGGVHAHGEMAGQPMTINDGWHLHKDGGLGGHFHKQEDLGIPPNVHNPSITI